jgi:quercetin dioxygenase-like cupin family protein
VIGEDATLREAALRTPVDLLLTGKDTGGRLLLILSLERRGCEPPRHRHRNEDEIVYVLDGELTYYLGEQEHRARAGSCLFLPRGGEHGFAVETQEARLLTLVIPAGLEGYYLELDEAGREDDVVTVEQLVTGALWRGDHRTSGPNRAPSRLRKWIVEANLKGGREHERKRDPRHRWNRFSRKAGGGAAARWRT